jgi:hypothetical protein
MPAQPKQPKGPIVNAEGRTHRIRRAIELGLVEVTLLALVGCIFTAVALVTRFVVGVDVV